MTERPRAPLPFLFFLFSLSLRIRLIGIGSYPGRDDPKLGLPEYDVQILVPTEAADFLRVSLDQLYHLTSSKKVPFAKVGGALRFDRAQLQEFVSAGGLQGNGSAPRNDGARKAAARGSNGTRSSAQSQDRSKFRFNTPPRPSKAKK